MSKELKNITEAVMDKIHHEKIRMRPRAYFVLGSILTFVGLIASILTSVFLIGLMRFSLRSHGPMGEYRLEQLLSSFPWWAPVIAVLGLIVGIWLLRHYDFSYKIDFKVIIIGITVAIITAGWLVDMLGLNDALLRRGPMQGMMKQYLQENNIQFEQGFGRHKNN
jgi:hypothetical protein